VPVQIDIEDIQTTIFKKLHQSSLELGELPNQAAPALHPAPKIVTKLKVQFISNL
jgi:hypothetical protein